MASISRTDSHRRFSDSTHRHSAVSERLYLEYTEHILALDNIRHLHLLASIKLDPGALDVRYCLDRANNFNRMYSEMVAPYLSVRRGDRTPTQDEESLVEEYNRRKEELEELKRNFKPVK